MDENKENINNINENNIERPATPNRLVRANPSIVQFVLQLSQIPRNDENNPHSPSQNNEGGR